MRSFFGRSDFPRPIVTWAGLQLSCHELRLFEWGCRKSLRHPWNKRSFFALTGVARLDVSDAPEGSIYFGCPLTQHLQLFNLLCAKEQRACVLGESDCVWGCGVVINFMAPLHPQACLYDPKYVELLELEWALDASQRTQLVPSAVMPPRVRCGGW